MTSQQRSSPDFASLAGALVAVASLVGGLLFEGGSIRDIAQPTAALIVLGGTLGAVLLSTPFATLRGAVQGATALFFDRPATIETMFELLMKLSFKARKSGIPTLEGDALKAEDPALRKALGLVVDNAPLPEIRSMMELEFDLEEMRLAAEARVFETAGGYAPTVGIIGAVLGLIQVMKHLENIDEVGRGIAVSFVATIYGVALANLLLLPAAAKLKARAAQVTQLREMTLEGVIGIAESMNPRLLRMKLEPFLYRAKHSQTGSSEELSPTQRRETATA